MNSSHNHSRTAGHGWLRALGIAAACGALGGCSILHTTSGTGRLLKAEQRAIIVTERSDPAMVETVIKRIEQTHGTPQGSSAQVSPAVAAGAQTPQSVQNTTQRTWTKETTRPVTRYVACAEPSPDVMTSYAAQFAASLSKTSPEGDKMSAEAKAALQQAAAFIGMRTPSIQLLRDAMYRVCEAYANGGIDSDQYELLMRRYQRQIVAMMAIESLTQAGRVPAITLTTQGSTGGERALSEWMGEIKAQQELSDKHQKEAESQRTKGEGLAKEIKGLEEDLEKDGLKDPEKQTLQQKIDTAKKNKNEADDAKAAAEAEVRRAKARVASLQDHMAGGASLTGRTAAEVASATAITSAAFVKAAAPTVLDIARRVLDVDDTAALCFIHYKQPQKENSSDGALRGLCDAHMTFMKSVQEARMRALDACMKNAGSDAAKVAKCVELVADTSQPGMGDRTYSFKTYSGQSTVKTVPDVFPKGAKQDD